MGVQVGALARNLQNIKENLMITTQEDLQKKKPKEQMRLAHSASSERQVR
jgi:hypothetical protein